MFDPQSGTRYTKDDDHVAQMIELVGYFPKTFSLSGRFSGDIFNRRGELRHIHKLRFWKLADVLVDKYHVQGDLAKDIAEFLGPMLTVIPRTR